MSAVVLKDFHHRLTLEKIARIKLIVVALTETAIKHALLDPKAYLTVNAILAMLWALMVCLAQPLMTARIQMADVISFVHTRAPVWVSALAIVAMHYRTGHASLLIIANLITEDVVKIVSSQDRVLASVLATLVTSYKDIHVCLLICVLLTMVDVERIRNVQSLVRISVIVRVCQDIFRLQKSTTTAL